MHLKSLVLRGFKSFADRSTLRLEPGITAIVGPNGSGKSNISDAVLWVLGERSARNLRGQAMEDIIFSGSAARKAVSVAEVELVLDNSDGTLPVEFDEVSIMRRMYRSGESEYLINGVVSRRMDVLDILHDSGLGTGTHSIISQGNLDAILQSKPEDRRALIEEAAGVLKHKQRKEKSARKLAAMDNHLARVRDVAAEVERQLGPLERKAKRAEAYKEASGELAKVKLALAVDDLRSLQEAWDRVCAEEAAASAEAEQRREGVEAAELKVNEIQELLRRQSEGAGELARHQRRASAVSERLDSVGMLVRERRRASLAYESDLGATLETLAAKRTAALEELASASAQFEELSAKRASSEAAVAQASARKEQAADALKQAELGMSEAERTIRDIEQRSEAARANQGTLKENLTSGLAHEKLVDARRLEVGNELAHAQEACEQAKSAYADAQSALDDLAERDKAAQSALGGAFEARNTAREALDAANERVSVLDSERKAVLQAQRASREGDPALLWLLDHAGEFGGDVVPLAHALKAPANLELLAERLLGDDLASLAIEDADSARIVARALTDGGRSGDVSLVLRHDKAFASSAPARSSKAGTALVDSLTYPASSARIVEALLGDVVVCSSADQAFSAHDADKLGCRFASTDGCVVWPSGKVTVYGAADGESEGVLARERRLEELETRLEQARIEQAQAKEAAAEADEAYRGAQEAALLLSQQLAEQKGRAQAAHAAADAAETKLSSAVREVSEIDRQYAAAKEAVAQLRPDVEKAAQLIAALVSEREAAEAHRAELAESIQPLREDSARAAEELTELKLEAAMCVERCTYAERLVLARKQDIAAIDRDEQDAKRLVRVKTAAKQRTDPLLATLDALSASLRRRMNAIDEAVSLSENASSGFHADAATARDAARSARDALDAASNKLAQTLVEKGRLEVQVDAAVNVVVRDCATPLDHVENLPQLEDRQAAEDEAFRLERRIKNMGVINPDAAEEYAQLKERYDFLAGQLADMEAARRSLAKITRVIDARMKDDFVSTFEEVNRNFAEIFALLFPGGHAYLSLENPDDIENTGVEVTAQPRGKRITKMMLMSGGEKSLTALALLFAVYRTRSTPFYILDEVEAALDDTNLRRLASYIDTLRSTTQLIMITHQRRTMEMADVLFGVSMQADGVTKVVSQKLERALEQAQ